MQYIPELTNQLADCLSQLGGQKDTIKLPKATFVYQIANQLCAISDNLNQIRIATQGGWWACLGQAHHNTRLSKH